VRRVADEDHSPIDAQIHASSLDRALMNTFDGVQL
jgi:hypothetical protein